MAAAGWWAVLIVQCLLGAWLADLSRRQGLLPAGGAEFASVLLVVAGVVTALQLLFTATGMLIAAKSGPASDAVDGGTPARDARIALRAWLSEAAHFAAMQGLMALEPWVTRRWDVHRTGSRPALLVHGIFCNRAIWWRLRRRLLALGYGPVVAVNLPRPGGGIDAQRAPLTAALERLRSLAPGAPVLVLAHSMGGLVLRELLTRLPQADLAHVVTIGTPHHGSVLARCCASAGCRDLRPGSAWLAANEASLRTVPVPATSIYSLDDDLVAPPASAHWPAARNVVVRGIGHFGLLAAARGIEAVSGAIEDVQ